MKMGLITRNTPVLVTGGTGFLASWIIKELLNMGITVHAIVTDKTKKNGFLLDIASETEGDLKLYTADLRAPNSCIEAMKGCNVVFYVSPSYGQIKDDQIHPYIKDEIAAVENVLNTSTAISAVKRVVFTSSCKAMYCDAMDCYDIPGGSIKEDSWNTKATPDYRPLSYIKTLTEKKAWELAQNKPWDLVTLNPSFILGPSLNPNAVTPGINFLKEIKNGIYKYGVPEIRTGVVDVRDLAKAHIIAGDKKEASGRYIASAHNTSLYEMINTLEDKYGKRVSLPKRVFPKWWVVLFGPILNKSLKREILKKNVGYYWSADNLKIKLELGITFRSLKETMEDAFASVYNGPKTY